MKDDPFFWQFAIMLAISLVGIYLPKDSPVGQALRRWSTDWLGKNVSPRTGCSHCEHCREKTEKKT